MLTCLHTYILTYLHPYLHTCILAYLHTYILTYLQTYLHTDRQTDTYIHTYTHTYILTYKHAYKHTYIHTYILTYLHTCIHAYMHTYVRTYIPTRTHIYLHTYIHTWIHTYIWNKNKVHDDFPIVGDAMLNSEVVSIWRFPKIGVPQIIQFMDDHDLVLALLWWLGVPPWLKKHPICYHRFLLPGIPPKQHPSVARPGCWEVQGHVVLDLFLVVLFCVFLSLFIWGFLKMKDPKTIGFNTNMV